MKKNAKREAPAESVSTAHMASPAWLPWLGWAALSVLLASIAYGPAMNGAFLFDDIALGFRANPNYSALGVMDVIRGVRPLTELSYWLNFQLASGDPFLYHLTSVLFHALSAVVLGYILWRLMTLLNLGAAMRGWLAALGAGIFLLHPAQTEAVAYISSRSEALSVFFYFAAVAVFLGRNNAEIGWGRALSVLTCFVLAMLSKEHALTLPITLVLLDLWVYRFSAVELARKGWRLYGLMAAGAALGAVVVMKTLSGALTAGFNMPNLSWWEYLLTQGRAIALYFRLFVLPVEQNGDYLFPISRNPMEHGAALYWIAIAAAAVAALVYRKSAPLLTLGIVLFLVLLGPTSSILPIQDAAVERRVYLASLGLVIGTVALLARLSLSPAVVRYGGALLLLALALGTYQRAGVWGSREVFWQDVYAKNPESWRANVQLGLTAFERKQCGEALARFEKALPHVSYDFEGPIHLNYANALDCANRPEEAEAEFKKSLEIEDRATTWTQLGVFYGKQQRYTEALDALNTAVARDPNFPLAYSNRGNVYARLGDCEKATGDFENALRLMPSNTTAQRGLAYCRERMRQ